MDVDEAIHTLSSVRRFRPDPVPEEHVREMVALALRAPIPSRQEVWRAVAVTDRALLRRMRDAVRDTLERIAAQPHDPAALGPMLGAGEGPDVLRRMKSYSLFFVQAPLVIAVAVLGADTSLGQIAARKMGRRRGPMGMRREGGPGVRESFRLLLAALGHSARRRLGLKARRRRSAPPWRDGASAFPGLAHFFEARPDLQALGAAIQNLTLAARARGYGSCWMTAPLVARPALEELLDLEPPWELAALVPIGIPAAPPKVRPRRPLEQVLTFVSDGGNHVPATDDEVPDWDEGIGEAEETVP